MKEFSTPFMKQYHAVKKQYPDCLVFYRMGDFYELFLEDAHIGAQVLNITLTSKSAGKEGKVPMAGIPYHAVDTYLTKLVKAGFKVAICEQLSPPNKKGLVERDVVRVVTPGTLLDEGALEKKENNYIVSVYKDSVNTGLSIADLSTGFFTTKEIENDYDNTILLNELGKLRPAECILPDELYNSDFLKNINSISGMNIFPFANFPKQKRNAYEFVCKHFQVITLESFGIDKKELAIKAAAALLSYLYETQKGNITHIKKIQTEQNDHLQLDRSTIINLELFTTIREHDTRGSLLSVLDHTVTAMGGRLLRQWMTTPLLEKEAIERRLEAVDYFYTNGSSTKKLRTVFKEIPDIERLFSRLSVRLGNARDLVNVSIALKNMLHTKEMIKTKSTLIEEEKNNIDSSLLDLIYKIQSILIDEPPIATKEGGMIRDGVDQKLDDLRSIITKSKDWIIRLEKEEREKTGISSLKIRFNKVFGFYIEISKANIHLAPSHYSRKQTLVNGERFITKELKEHEEIILTAEEKINELEYAIYSELLEHTLSYGEQIQKAAMSIAVLDCLSTFGILSEKNKYTCPTLLYSGELRLTDSRHPVVEQLVEYTSFVPNDITLDNVSQQLLLITGPNMAGKSVLIRQVALIVLMAQMGCFVPAKKAHISIVDKIFVRSGASDVITSGLSTFMVEMVETAHILHNATDKSLIIMDEIGRGTSTYDGISIAWAVAEYLVTAIKPSPKTLFATHYHELQSLEEQYPKSIKNYHMAVINEKGSPVFLHTFLPGGASHSFGVAVAKLAGVPESVVQKAEEVLQTLEYRDVTDNKKVYFSREELPQLPPRFAEQILEKEISSIDISSITPLEALNKLAELKNKIKLLDEQTHFKAD